MDPKLSTRAQFLFLNQHFYHWPWLVRASQLVDQNPQDIKSYTIINSSPLLTNQPCRSPPPPGRPLRGFSIAWWPKPAEMVDFWRTTGPLDHWTSSRPTGSPSCKHPMGILVYRYPVFSIRVQIDGYWLKYPWTYPQKYPINIHYEYEILWNHHIINIEACSNNPFNTSKIIQVC